ncbi:uncharacterized protein LOC100200328 [Hydra vulgaris]|uniref:Uncharacterized protein LOC100200328 n=1 Tax=Hydra vulgaris TaxID=6087 RepID=A0ABM4BD89_HYDVU
MDEKTYDIIDWKSCESFSISSKDDEGYNSYHLPRYNPFVKDEIASTTDIVFPTLFHDKVSETSIVTIDENEMSTLHALDQIEAHPDQLEQQNMYQKVANWMHNQRKYFRHVERVIEDDELEMIDPVDLFHESILKDYWLITETESERRILLRDFYSYRHHIESIEQGLITNEFKFIREPPAKKEMELVPIKDFHLFHKLSRKKKKKKHDDDSSSLSSYIEKTEESIDFLGVPRLLENYVVLNREGYAININEQKDIWHFPLDEHIVENKNDDDDDKNFDIEFLSSWFSDVYQDILTDDQRTTFTINTDIFEKVTVISVSQASDEEIWEDAPDIPHWLDDENQDLELFNQPSKPLYYYRDRIKGCYRIIGVEDETVILFSGNDDDTIFYPSEEWGTEHLPDNAVVLKQNISLGCNIASLVDLKNDSGIEDDDVITDESTLSNVSNKTDFDPSVTIKQNFIKAFFQKNFKWIIISVVTLIALFGFINKVSFKVLHSECHFFSWLTNVI